MLQARLINFLLMFVMAAYLPLWICCASHAAAVPADGNSAAEPIPACHAAAGGPCSTSAPRTDAPDQPEHRQPDHECTCIDRASAAFVNKTVTVSLEPVQPLFDLLPGSLGKITDGHTTQAGTPRVLVDASPPGGPLLDQFCLLTT
jgi:hypothetical protein